MIFLGLEQPVAYGREQVFDPTTAQMVLNANRDYINAVYRDYQQAMADMKEFNKEYGDFLSPIQADMDLYNREVSGNIRDFINNLYSQGIDPLRSQEGRAAIQRKLASIDDGLVRDLRQRALNANKYIASRDALKATGQYDPDYERAMLGGQLLEEWDNSLGGWKATSASPYLDYEKKYGHLFDKMGYEYDPEESKKFPGMRAFTKSKSRMHDILSASRPDLVNDPQYRYDLQRIKNANPGISDNDASRLLENEIIERNYKGGMELKEDPIYMMDLKQKYAQALLGQRLAGKKGGSGSGDEDNEENYRTTFMDRLRQNVDQHVEEKLFGSKTTAQSIAGMADYWDKMAKSVESQGTVKSKETTTDYVSRPVEKNSFSRYTFGGLPTFRYDGSEEYKNIPTEKTTVTYDQSNNAKYNQYTYERDRWVNFGNTGQYQVSKYDTSKEAAEVRKIMKNQAADDRKLAQIKQKYSVGGQNSLTKDDIKFLSDYSKNKEIVDAYQQNDIMRTMYKAYGNSPGYLGKGNQPKGTTSTADLKRRSSAFWDSFRAESLSNHQLEVLQNQFDGNAVEVKDPNLPNSYKELSLGSNYSYAPIRQSNIAGSGRFKYNDVHRKFDRWLHSAGTTLMSFSSNNIQSSILPIGGRVGGQLDIMKAPIITREQFKEFYEKAGGSKLGTMDDVAQKLGLGIHKKSLTYKGKDDVLHETDTYYTVPIIKTLDPSAFRDINVESNKLEFGASEAAKGAVDSENQALMDQQLLEAALGILN